MSWGALKSSDHPYIGDLRSRIHSPNSKKTEFGLSGLIDSGIVRDRVELGAVSSNSHGEKSVYRITLADGKPQMRYLIQEFL